MDGSDSVRSWEGVMRDYMAVTSLRFQNVDNSIGVIVFGTNVTAQSSDTMLPLLKSEPVKYIYKKLQRGKIN